MAMPGRSTSTRATASSDTVGTGTGAPVPSAGWPTMDAMLTVGAPTRPEQVKLPRLAGVQEVVVVGVARDVRRRAGAMRIGDPTGVLGRPRRGGARTVEGRGARVGRRERVRDRLGCPRRGIEDHHRRVGDLGERDVRVDDLHARLVGGRHGRVGIGERLVAGERVEGNAGDGRRVGDGGGRAPTGTSTSRSHPRRAPRRRCRARPAPASAPGTGVCRRPASPCRAACCRGW